MSLRKIKIDATSQVSPSVVPVHCPHCGKESNFENAGTSDIRGSNMKDGVNTVYRIGVRRCPRSECRGQLYYQEFGGEVVTYPVQRIDFDSSDVPDNIVSAFDEALSCEAHNLHIAAAIMVRKTLELICIERKTSGDNLKTRIRDLQKQVTLPKQLFTAMDNLRLLGNDAAHVESSIFEEIGKDEILLAIDLTKEIIKGIYQLDSIVNRLELLKSKNDEA